MVSIGKLGKGQEIYYLDSVAGGADDYYVGEGEAPGRWTGSGSAELGLEGEVEREQLGAVLAARDPRTNAALPRFVRRDRVPGFDVTFSAPKSVSVVWATADEQTAARIRTAHERSVEAALGFLEHEAAFTRLGRDGHTAARGSGFVAATFRHRMSRAGDPQLHTHVLVANLIRTSDSEWRSLDGHRLYRRAKTAGYLYQAHLRAELHRELGLAFREVHRGAAEIAAAHRQGATVGEVERLADRFLARVHVAELGELRPPGARGFAASEPLYTTREVIRLEERLVAGAERHARERLAVARPAAVEAALARDPALAEEQREMVRRLAEGGEGTICVVGRAGAGKTRALRPLREAFEAAGVEVIGAPVPNPPARN